MEKILSILKSLMGFFKKFRKGGVPKDKILAELDYWWKFVHSGGDPSDDVIGKVFEQTRSSDYHVAEKAVEVVLEMLRRDKVMQRRYEGEIEYLRKEICIPLRRKVWTMYLTGTAAEKRSCFFVTSMKYAFLEPESKQALKDLYVLYGNEYGLEGDNAEKEWIQIINATLSGTTDTSDVITATLAELFPKHKVSEKILDALLGTWGVDKAYVLKCLRKDQVLSQEIRQKITNLFDKSTVREILDGRAVE